MGAVKSKVEIKSTDEASPAINGQVLDVVYRDERDELHNVKDLGNIRKSALFFSKVDFPAEVLRHRLNRSLDRIRLADGTRLDTLLAFDTQSVVGAQLLLAAIWMMEEQRWDEVAEVLQLASQCGCCTLPVNLTADDIRTHASKTAYLLVARVLAQLMVVGRHIDFGDGSRLQIFRRANDEVRAIRDLPSFRLTVDPPLPAGHLYQRHRLQHDPPVRSRIDYEATPADGRVGGGRLDGLLTQSPHTPVAGCTTTLSRDERVRRLVLTDSSHNFVAWIAISDVGYDYVFVDVWTTEAPVPCVSGSFKDRFPVTTQLARVALGRVAPYVFDGQVDDDSDDDNDSDGHGGGWDDMDDDSDGDGSGEEDSDEGDGDNDGDDSDGDGGNESDEMDVDSEHGSGGEDASAEEENGSVDATHTNRH
ncbi:unnamed protein product [Vitrella brassicaformis CCMP3155]|uniref:Uncharacterized protein n=1 Tax=Vitrella brassicaformis (strain CCMP3155) TaxID=1169540 RepID=A0A0G4F8I6_VITBC|nr:unnamed protein product [Vitrella brassicaformis CCMP3155]|eukprot:CEM09020.1 unnamed protein product [Vitrella brassicaformis CCMP3155]